MSTLKVNNLQVGQDGTAANNYTLYQPASPDGTVRLGYGVAGSVTDILTLKNSRLGIGTDNPEEDLHIASNSPYILLDDIDNSRKWKLKGTAWFAIEDTTSGVDRLRIGSDGFVNIGSNENARKTLDITGPDGRSGASSGNSDTVLLIDNSGTNGGILEFLSNNNSYGRIFFTDTDAVNQGQIVYEHQNDAFQFSTAGSESVRITGGTVYITASSNTNNAQLSLGRPNSTSAGYIRYLNSDNALAFRTGGSGEDVRIDSSGRLLVGTNSVFGGGSVGELLQVGYNGGSRIIIGNTSSSLSDGTLIAQIDFNTRVGGTVSTGASIKVNCDGSASSGDAPSKLTFNTTVDGESTPSPKMTIRANGDVGIGTGNPDTKLHIYNNGGGYATDKAGMLSNAVMKLQPHTTDSTNMLFASVNGGAGIGIQVTNGPATANWDVVLSPFGGNVGIGDVSPSQKLNVDGNIMLEGSNQFCYLSNVGTGNAGIYVRGYSSGSTSNHFLRSHSTNMFTWEVTGQEKMRLTSAGRMGLGYNSPDTMATGRLVIGDGTGSETLTIFSSNNTNGNIHFADGTSGQDRYRGYITYQHSDGTNDNFMAFGTNDIERLRIDANGNVSVGILDRRRNQIISGRKTFSASNSFMDLFYSGHSHSITIHYQIIQNENWAYGGAHGKVEFFTAYGSTNGMQNHTHRRLGMNGGQISGDAEFQYLNTGGSVAHIIRVRVPYSSTSLGSFQIAYSVTGLSSDSMYPL